MKWLKYINKILGRKEKKEKVYGIEDLNISEREEYVNKLKLVSSLKKNIESIQELFGDSIDLSIRKITIGIEEVKAAVIFMGGLSDTQVIEEIIEALQINLLEIQQAARKADAGMDEMKIDEIFKLVREKVLNNKDIGVTEKMSEILKEITCGSTVVLIDGVTEGIICESKGFQVRSIQEPESEISIRGPRDGFVENIFTNTSLIRQRLRVPHLWIQDFELGSLSKINVALVYIKGLASEELVEEVKSRLKKIDVDAVLESGYVQEFIHDEPITLFPLLKRTERPDRVVSCLVEGKVAILTEGTPFALIMPVDFSLFLQAPDDYYEAFPVGTFIRILRYIAFVMSIFLPGIYVAVINFHPELLPAELLLRITATREGVPFPVLIEALLMEGLFEILREAGVRLPRAIGSAISIVGALVLGEAAINAGLASPPMIIIVALTAIASFTNPDYTMAIAARILRFAFLFLGAAIGLFGIQVGILILLVHLCALRSFGQPYFKPFGPLVWQNLKDSIIRVPWWGMTKRPKLVGGRNPRRIKRGQKPQPPAGKEGEEGDEE